MFSPIRAFPSIGISQWADEIIPPSKVAIRVVFGPVPGPVRVTSMPNPGIDAAYSSTSCETMSFVRMSFVRRSVGANVCIVLYAEIIRRWVSLTQSDEVGSPALRFPQDAPARSLAGG